MNLVTGGAGFIGINLVKELLSRGEGVRVLDIAALDQDIAKQVQFLKLDIRDKQGVIQACKDIDCVYHIISLVPISKAGKGFWDVNVEGTRNILQGALECGVKKIIHMSSSSVYDINQQHPLTEETPIKPLGVYAHSKYDAELVCCEYRKIGLNVNIVRPRTVVGAGRLGVYQILFDWLRRGKRIYLIGPGNNKIQFIHVKDLAEAMISMAKKADNETFNIGTEGFGTLRQDLEALIDYAKTGSKVVGLPAGITIGFLRMLDWFNLSPLADWHYLSYSKDFYFDISKAKKMLDWQPRYTNIEMLIEAYQWYIEHLREAEVNVGTTHRKSVKQRLLKFLRDLS
jgi:nucleoside-diphosphate-sugar epimerase